MKRKLSAVLVMVGLVVALAVPAVPAAAASSPIVVDFETTTLTKGDSVLGLGTVNSYLNIQSSQDVVLVKEGESPRAYNAGGMVNGCLDGNYGIGDKADEETAADKKIEDYQFMFAPGLTVNSFSVTLFDYGDYFPYPGTGDHIAKLVGYDASDNPIPGAVDTLAVPIRTDNGDACHASSPGVHTFIVSGTGIAKVKVEFVGDYSVDTGIALDNVTFTLEEWDVTVNAEENGNSLAVPITGTYDSASASGTTSYQVSDILNGSSLTLTAPATHDEGWRSTYSTNGPLTQRSIPRPALPLMSRKT